MKSKSLNYNHNTIIKSHQYQSYMEGIIRSNKQKGTLDWLTCRSLRVILDKDKFSIYYPGDCPNLLNELVDTPNDCFIRKIYSFKHEDILNNREKFLKDIETFIEDGFYIYGKLNEFYIPDKSAYKTKQYIHDYLLVGFDSKNFNMKIVGYTKKQICKEFNVNYDDFILAITGIDKTHSEFYLYKLKEDYVYDFDIKLVKKSIKEFINSYSESDYKMEEYVYGKSALIELNNINNEGFIKNNEFIYTRNMISFCEHAFFFYNLIKYLIENEYLINEKIFNDVIKNSDYIILLKNFIIKYKISKENCILEKIKNITQNIIENEILAADKLNNIIGTKE